jgi:hypothetical protein
VVYRASAFGGCERALTAARLGYEPAPPPASLQATYNAGHAAEEWFNTLTILDNQQDSVRLDIPGTNMSIIGHIDGMRLGRVVEIKSQSAAEFDKWTEDSWTTDPLWMKYAWQTSIYRFALGGVALELIRIRRPPPDSGEGYSYKAHYYPHAFHGLDEIYYRARYLESLTELPPCTTTRTFGCPYYQFHEDRRELIEDSELDDACAAYTNAKTNEKYAKELVGLAKERVVKALRDRKDVATNGGWSVKHTTFATKERVTPAGEQSRLTVSELK